MHERESIWIGSGERAGIRLDQPPAKRGACVAAAGLFLAAHSRYRTGLDFSIRQQQGNLVRSAALNPDGKTAQEPGLRSRIVRVLSWLGPLLAIAGLDYLFGPEIRLIVLYALPIGLAAWQHGRELGLALAVAIPLFRLSHWKMASDP